MRRSEVGVAAFVASFAAGLWVTVAGRGVAAEVLAGIAAAGAAAAAMDRAGLRVERGAQTVFGRQVRVLRRMRIAGAGGDGAAGVLATEVGFAVAVIVKAVVAGIAIEGSAGRVAVGIDLAGVGHRCLLSWNDR
ncbi:hypothetical protein WR25_24230 [Diploscapter pachys]|uniref:Uncharacterized protein n=1 Tax=Diploscapter pachys TaxID=2018661 RepID=A0A2A2KAE1_9BILA|nr:hypothetical protein WR25_24230 [Diploscapter pachys]